MILLDTNHLATLKYRGTERYVRLTARLAGVDKETIGVTVITVEEQFRGWIDQQLQIFGPLSSINSTGASATSLFTDVAGPMDSSARLAST